jgi:hypothetical protein
MIVSDEAYGGDPVVAYLHQNLRGGTEENHERLRIASPRPVFEPGTS